MSSQLLLMLTLEGKNHCKILYSMAYFILKKRNKDIFCNFEMQHHHSNYYLDDWSYIFCSFYLTRIFPPSLKVPLNSLYNDNEMQFRFQMYDTIWRCNNSSRALGSVWHQPSIAIIPRSTQNQIDCTLLGPIHGSNKSV